MLITSFGLVDQGNISIAITYHAVIFHSPYNMEYLGNSTHRFHISWRIGDQPIPGELDKAPIQSIFDSTDNLFEERLKQRFHSLFFHDLIGK